MSRGFTEEPWGEALWQEVMVTDGQRLIMWRADDDMWDGDYLEKLIVLRDANPNARLAVARTVQKRITGDEQLVRGEIPFPKFEPSDIGRMRMLSRGTPSWVFGLFDRETIRIAFDQAANEYAEAWGCDELLIFYFA